MAATVIPFPGNNVPNLPDIEKVVRNCLDELTGDGELVEHVSRRMMAYIEKYTFRTISPAFTLPAMAPEQKQASWRRPGSGEKPNPRQMCPRVFLFSCEDV